MDDKRLKELPADVSASLKGLILKELESGSKTCFARAGKVAELAQSLAGMYYTRVEDVKDAHDALGMLNPLVPQDGYGLRRAVMPYAQGGAGIPQAPEDTVRDALSTAMPLLRTMTLHTLLMLKPQAEALGLDPKMIDDQLKTAAAKLVTDSETLNPPKPAEALNPRPLLRVEEFEAAPQPAVGPQFVAAASEVLARAE